MAEHHALGAVGRAARVEDGERVALVDGGVERLGAALRRQVGHVVFADDAHAVDEMASFVVHDGQHRAGGGQGVAHLLLSVADVEGRQHRAQAHDGEADDRPPHVVGHQHGDPVAVAHAEVPEAAGEAVGAPVELGIGDQLTAVAVAEDVGGLARHRAGVTAHDVAEHEGHAPAYL